MYELLTLASSSTAREPSLHILVLEARTLCSAATGRNGGHLQPLVHAAPPDILEFEMANFDHVSHIIHLKGIECDYRRLSGCLGFWNKTYFREAKRALTQTSAGSSDLVRMVEDAKELQDLGLKGGAVGAMVQTVAASLSPYKLCVSMWQEMLSRYEGGNGGVKLNLQATTPVTSLERVGNPSTTTDSNLGWVLHTPRGIIHARTVILAINGYTSHLLPKFTPLIRPVQAQMSALTPPAAPEVSHDQQPRLIPMSYGFEGIGSMDRVMSDYLVQNPFTVRSRSEQTASESGGQLMFGGGRHMAANHGEAVWDDDFVDKNVEKYLRSLPERLNLTFGSSNSSKTTTTSTELLDIDASWTGIIGHSLDGNPWVGAVPDHAGLFLCAGYTGHGMTNAPLCGRYVAQLALEGLAPELGVWQHQRQEGTDHWHGAVPRKYLISTERMERAIRASA